MCRIVFKVCGMWGNNEVVCVNLSGALYVGYRVQSDSRTRLLHEVTTVKNVFRKVLLFVSVSRMPSVCMCCGNE